MSRILCKASNSVVERSRLGCRHPWMQWGSCGNRRTGDVPLPGEVIPGRARGWEDFLLTLGRGRPSHRQADRRAGGRQTINRQTKKSPSCTHTEWLFETPGSCSGGTVYRGTGPAASLPTGPAGRPAGRGSGTCGRLGLLPPWRLAVEGSDAVQ